MRMNSTKLEKYRYIDDSAIDGDEIVMGKLGSLVAMMHSNEVIKNADFMCIVAQSPALTNILMQVFGDDTKFDLCKRLLACYPKALSSKSSKEKFVVAMKKQISKPHK